MDSISKRRLTRSVLLPFQKNEFSNPKRAANTFLNVCVLVEKCRELEAGLNSLCQPNSHRIKRRRVDEADEQLNRESNQVDDIPSSENPIDNTPQEAESDAEQMGERSYELLDDESDGLTEIAVDTSFDDIPQESESNKEQIDELSNDEIDVVTEITASSSIDEPAIEAPEVSKSCQEEKEKSVTSIVAEKCMPEPNKNKSIVGSTDADRKILADSISLCLDKMGKILSRRHSITNSLLSDYFDKKTGEHNENKSPVSSTNVDRKHLADAVSLSLEKMGKILSRRHSISTLTYEPQYISVLQPINSHSESVESLPEGEIDKTVAGISTLKIDNGKSSQTNQEEKENQKPWYEGIVVRPVAFRATRRRSN